MNLGDIILSGLSRGANDANDQMRTILAMQGLQFEMDDATRRRQAEEDRLLFESRKQDALMAQQGAASDFYTGLGDRGGWFESTDADGLPVTDLAQRSAFQGMGTDEQRDYSDFKMKTASELEFRKLTEESDKAKLRSGIAQLGQLRAQSRMPDKNYFELLEQLFNKYSFAINDEATQELLRRSAPPPFDPDEYYGVKPPVGPLPEGSAPWEANPEDLFVAQMAKRQGRPLTLEEEMKAREGYYKLGSLRNGKEEGPKHKLTAEQAGALMDQMQNDPEKSNRSLARAKLEEDLWKVGPSEDDGPAAPTLEKDPAYMVIDLDLKLAESALERFDKVNADAMKLPSKRDAIAAQRAPLEDAVNAALQAKRKHILGFGQAKTPTTANAAAATPGQGLNQAASPTADDAISDEHIGAALQALMGMGIADPTDEQIEQKARELAGVKGLTQ